MHSFTDCAVGVLMGAGIWWVHDGTGAGVGVWGRGLRVWLRVMAGEVCFSPFFFFLCFIYNNVLSTLILILQSHSSSCHSRDGEPASPADPCFEDAITFVSVGMGSLLSRWHAVPWGFDDTFFRSVMPGSLGDTWERTAIWWTVAATKMLFGESCPPHARTTAHVCTDVVC
jgi:dihydrosphingosine 1-phosphate phosphatase